MLFFNKIFLSQRLIKFFTILVVLLSLLPFNKKRNYFSGKFSALTSLSSTIRIRLHLVVVRSWCKGITGRGGFQGQV